MRVAIAGKGGAGKTTISATLARLAARHGVPVVAVDGDSNPNLAPALGIDRATAAAAGPLPLSLVSRKLTGPALKVPVAEALEQFAVGGPDGVKLVLMGMPAHAEEGCMCSSHAVISGLLADLGGDAPELAILDLEASPEHLGRGTARHADVLLLVTEPYYRSLEAARRMAALAAETAIGRVAAIANKIRTPADAEAVGEFCVRHGIEQVGEVPFSHDVLDADAAGRPLIDACPSGPVVSAIAAVGQRLKLFGGV